jgi:hypothetical protein
MTDDLQFETMPVDAAYAKSLFAIAEWIEEEGLECSFVDILIWWARSLPADS